MPLSTPLTTISEDCGARLRTLRTLRQQTLKDMAHTTGLSRSHIAAIERGEVNTPIETLALLAWALGVTLADVVTEGHDEELFALYYMQTQADNVYEACATMPRDFWHEMVLFIQRLQPLLAT